uniref:Sjoegren syndrome/scleroderma autoantigen 1 n=1 Tax=Ciona savignyi TaxID=51511 RepID=H2ZB58_CIOSA
MKSAKDLETTFFTGYRMLDMVCEKCDTILMQPRDGQIFCVACTEMESEISKDDPVTNPEAARSVVREQEERTDVDNEYETPAITNACSAPIMNAMSDAVRATSKNRTFPQNTSDHAHISGDRARNLGEVVVDHLAPVKITAAAFNKPNETALTTHPLETPVPGVHPANLHDTLNQLHAKILHYTEGLKETDNLESSVKLAEAIKSCADSIYAVKKII